MREGWEILRGAWGLIILLDLGLGECSVKFTVQTRLDLCVSFQRGGMKFPGLVLLR